MIAASIVASRALAPLEGTIEGWRSFVQARSAYARDQSPAAELAAQPGPAAAAAARRDASTSSAFSMCRRRTRR